MSFNGQWWSVERTEELRFLIAADKSAAEIAPLMGLNRNQVLGKAFRMGWPIRGGHKSATEAERVKSKTAIRVRLRKPRPKRAKKMRPAPKPEAERLSSLSVPLISLGSRACHYPDGAQYDPPRTFCGRPVFKLLPYCEHHCRVSYTTPEERKRRQREEVRVAP